MTDCSKRPSKDPATADERLDTAEGRRELWRAVFSCWLGTTMECADFALYGLAAGIIFGDVFFPEASPTMALLSSFATWSVGFVARPIGALSFGALGDREGRKWVMVTTVTLMGVSTTMIGLIPRYASIGMWAPGCLVLLRFAQGFGAGAEISGGTVMLGEYAATGRRGLVCSVTALGANSGTLLASVLWLTAVQMNKSDFSDWGWRVPFLGSSLITMVALWIRRNLRETPVFERQKARLQADRERLELNADRQDDLAPTESWLRSKSFWTMVGLRIGENGPSYLSLGFLVGYMAKVLEMNNSVATTAVVIAAVLGFPIVPLAGWLSDRFGRRPVYRTISLLLIIYPWPAFVLMDYRDPFIVVSAVVVGISLSTHVSFGVHAAWGVELFGVRHRYTKMAVAKELGAIVSGGVAPLVATTLYSLIGHWWPIALYFSIMATVSFLTTFVAPETRGRDLDLLEDAI